MKNPITEKEYDEPREYVESLIECLIATQNQLFSLENDAKELIIAIDKAAGFPEEKVGKFNAIGTSQVVEVKRKQNASYPRERDETHPLRKLLAMFEDLIGPMISVDYREKGSEISKFVERMKKDGITTSDDERDLYAAIKEVRTLNSGKPTFTIKQLDNQNETKKA